MVVSGVKIHALLANTPIFGRLDEREIQRIAKHSRQIRADRGTLLFNRGARAEGLHLVIYGQVKLFFTSLRGDEKVLAVLGPGQSFGEAVMFTRELYPVTGQSLVDSLVLFVHADAIAAELHSDPHLATRVIAGLCRQINTLIADVQAHSMSFGAQRVIGYLLRGCNGAETGAFDVTLPTSKGIIASQLNLTQEHFSRILHQLIARGLVVVNGRLVRIVDVAKLRERSRSNGNEHRAADRAPSPVPASAPISIPSGAPPRPLPRSNRGSKSAPHIDIHWLQGTRRAREVPDP